MPTDAVWVFITVPQKEYEEERRKSMIRKKDENSKNVLNSEEYCQTLLSHTLEELQIHDVIWMPTHNQKYFQVYFPCELIENDWVLNVLKSKGIGTKKDTSIGFIPFNLFFYQELSDTDEDELNECDQVNGKLDVSESPKRNSIKSNKYNPLESFKEVTQNFLKSVTSRLTVAQVVEGVKTGSQVTFDYCVYTLMAGLIAAFGLVNNDPVNIAASMMIEPIMGTVMAMAFGLVIEDRQLFMSGLKSNIISLIICLISGFLMGLLLFIDTNRWYSPLTNVWPTNEMRNRGTAGGLIYGVLIALPCGGAVAVTLLNENHAALVGVAVASTFLPPFINTGLLWAYSVHLEFIGINQSMKEMTINGQNISLKQAWAPLEGYQPVYSNDMRVESALLGCVSMALTELNIVCMLAVAYIVLKIKEVVPMERISPGTQRFFRHDIRITRKYNRSLKTTEEPLGQQILKEWAEISGIDENQLLDNSPEAQVTQLQTLCDIAEDVEADETYQLVMKHAMGKPDHNSGLARRLTQPALLGYDGHKNHGNPVMRSSKTWAFESKPKPEKLIRKMTRHPKNQLLAKSLKKTFHSPYSVWPSNQTGLSRAQTTAHPRDRYVNRLKRLIDQDLI